MIRGIAHGILAGRLLWVTTPPAGVVLCLLLVGHATGGKEAKTEDVVAPEFSVPGGVYTNDLKVAIKSVAGLVRFS